MKDKVCFSLWSRVDRRSDLGSWNACWDGFGIVDGVYIERKRASLEMAPFKMDGLAGLWWAQCLPGWQDTPLF